MTSAPPPPQSQSQTQPAPDPQAHYALEMARSRQSFGLAAAAGTATMAATALAWAAITALTHFQIGFMAIGVGVAVGLVVRAAGKGLGPPFQMLGAGLALAGCVAGNLLAACVFLADANGVPVLQVLEVLDLALARQLLEASFSPMDLLFYGIAVWEAWRLSVLVPAAGASSAG